ncbi:MAG: M48 family metalloprotease [Thermodesulfobacteriota bacterium]
MFYSNVIYLLVVILFFSASSPADRPQLSLLTGLLFFFLKLAAFREAVRFFFRPFRIRKPPHYFDAERKLSILAVAMVAADVYLLDCQYYLARLPLARDLPTLANGAGVLLFFLYLSLMWAGAAEAYGVAFGRRKGRWQAVSGNLKSNLPVVIPWFLISLLSDLLRHLHVPYLSRLLATAWGEGLVLLAFFLLLAVFFPAIMVRMWGCEPLEAGETRRRIEDFCRRQRLAYREILVWPLFEGQVLTAGVIGLVGRFRYLLVTRSLLLAMTPEEIEAVMAHEIGHVKKHHMPLYLLFFLGFGLFAQLASYPLLYLVLNSNLFYTLVDLTSKEPNSALTVASTISMLLLMVVYFRYIFGYFMRNFERQADLHVFAAMGDARPLINVLEKIGYLSGNTRDLPCWHHFSIGQRVDFLERCRKTMACVRHHEGKVRASLLAFVVALLSAGLLLASMPDDLLAGAPREKFAEAVLRQKIRQSPDNFLWFLLLADLQQGRKRYGEAIAAYEKALALSPTNPEIMNNLAWLYLTAEDEEVRDTDQALVLASDAAKLRPTGYILDTLALAYWENGYQQLAIATAQKAMAVDPANAAYYREQLGKFGENSPDGG